MLLAEMCQMWSWETPVIILPRNSVDETVCFTLVSKRYHHDNGACVSWFVKQESTSWSLAFRANSKDVRVRTNHWSSVKVWSSEMIRETLTEVQIKKMTYLHVPNAKSQRVEDIISVPRNGCSVTIILVEMSENLKLGLIPGVFCWRQSIWHGLQGNQRPNFYGRRSRLYLRVEDRLLVRHAAGTTSQGSCYCARTSGTPHLNLFCPRAPRFIVRRVCIYFRMYNGYTVVYDSTALVMYLLAGTHLTDKSIDSRVDWKNCLEQLSLSHCASRSCWTLLRNTKIKSQSRQVLRVVLPDPSCYNGPGPVYGDLAGATVTEAAPWIDLHGNRCPCASYSTFPNQTKITPLHRYFPGDAWIHSTNHQTNSRVSANGMLHQCDNRNTTHYAEGKNGVLCRWVTQHVVKFQSQENYWYSRIASNRRPHTLHQWRKQRDIRLQWQKLMVLKQRWWGGLNALFMTCVIWDQVIPKK
jgi:hypothetical protein